MMLRLGIDGLMEVATGRCVKIFCDVGEGAVVGDRLSIRAASESAEAAATLTTTASVP